MQNTSVRRCFCDFELLNELESQLADIHQQFKQNYLNEFENIGDSYLQIRRNKNLILSSDKLTVTHTSNSQLHSDAVSKKFFVFIKMCCRAFSQLHQLMKQQVLDITKLQY